MRQCRVVNKISVYALWLSSPSNSQAPFSVPAPINSTASHSIICETTFSMPGTILTCRRRSSRPRRNIMKAKSVLTTPFFALGYAFLLATSLFA